MKKTLFLTALVIVMGLAATSCNFLKNKVKGADAAAENVIESLFAEDTATEDLRMDVQDFFPEDNSMPRSIGSVVYACAYDGFVNIRKTPSARADIVGKFKNGPEGAVKLGEEGSWTQINNKGIIGYVLSKYVCGTPTVPVDERVSMSWLEGMWDDNAYGVHSNEREFTSGLMIFDNGRFKQYNFMFNEGAFTSEGTFIIEGSNLVLTETYDYVGDTKTNSKFVVELDPARKTIKDYYKVRFLRENEKINWEEYGGSGLLMLTKKEFRRMGSQ